VDAGLVAEIDNLLLGEQGVVLDLVSRDIVHSHSHVTTWKSMEKLVGTGKVKAIGVSNYSVSWRQPRWARQ
jgi:diketogulonate reductase-like aldo/keto reductase